MSSKRQETIGKSITIYLPHGVKSIFKELHWKHNTNAMNKLISNRPMVMMISNYNDPNDVMENYFSFYNIHLADLKTSLQFNG